MSDRRSFLGSLLALGAAPLANAEAEAEPVVTGLPDDRCRQPFSFVPSLAQAEVLEKFLLQRVERRQGYASIGCVTTACCREIGHTDQHRNEDGFVWPCGAVAGRAVTCGLQAGHDDQHHGFVYGQSKGEFKMVREMFWP